MKKLNEAVLAAYRWKPDN